MSVMETISRRPSPSLPPQSGRHCTSTGTFTGSTSAACSGGFRNRKNPCPGFRPGRLGFGFRVPLENGASALQLLNFGPKPLNHSVLVKNDLNQFFAAERFQVFQDPGCINSFVISRTFKSSDTLFRPQPLIKYFWPKETSGQP